MPLSLKWLPWPLFVLVVLSLSIGCVYYAKSLKHLPIMLRISFLGFGITGPLIGIERVAQDTGILARYLPVLKPLSMFFFGISYFFF